MNSTCLSVRLPVCPYFNSRKYSQIVEMQVRFQRVPFQVKIFLIFQKRVINTVDKKLQQKHAYA